MKTAFLVQSMSRSAGGLFVSVRQLAQALGQTSEVDISVLALRDRFSEEDKSIWSPLEPQVFEHKGPAAFGYSPALRQRLHRVQPDIVHVHGLWQYPSVACHGWHRATGFPYLVSPRGMLDAWDLRHSYWKKRLAGWVYQNSHLRDAACLHALCESERQSMRDYGLRNPICIIPNGIDMPESVAAPPPWQGRMQEGQKVFLFLSRIHPKKGLANLLRAWSRPGRAESRGWVLAIAGWDQKGHEQELKQLATETGLAWSDVRSSLPEEENRVGGARPAGHNSPPAAVLFLGPQFGEAKAACFQHCDAFILPSVSEGLPMAVLEAWAYGKPVLMTPECNLPEGFSAGAAVRTEHDPEHLAKSLQDMFRLADAERQEIGQRGRGLVKQKFAMSTISQQMLTVYKWTLGGGSKPEFVETSK